MSFQFFAISMSCLLSVKNSGFLLFFFYHLDKSDGSLLLVIIHIQGKLDDY